MLHQILVPLDGSALAEQALPWVHEIAALTGATVTLVQVVEPTDAVLDLLALQPAMERAAQDYLAQAAQQLAQDRMTVQTRVVVGRPAEQVIHLAHGVDLIVMATHGRSGIGRWVYGSVADKVLSGAPVPVLLIHVRPAQARPAQPLRRILIPLDGSALAERALPLASWLAQRAGAELVVIRSTEWDRAVAAVYLSGDTVAALTQQYVEAAQDYLRQVSEPLRGQGLAVQTDVRHDPPAEAILASAAQQEADLIVMSTHGRSGLGRWLLGSTAERVLGHAAIPVLLVRAGSLTAGEPAAPSQPGSAAVTPGEPG